MASLFSTPVDLMSNATRQAPPMAAATTERRLLAVACTRLFGWNAPWDCEGSTPAPARGSGGGCPPCLDADSRVVLHAGPTTLRRFHATTYWITSVAWNRTDEDRVRPSAWAVLRLMTSSNLVGCSTGKSAGFVPFRILSTKVGTRLYM